MMQNAKEMNARLRNPKTRTQTLIELGEWMKDTCLLFGVSPGVTYRCTATFLDGIAAEVKPDEDTQ